MAGFVIERHGFATGAALFAQVVTDMLANGFTLVDQTNGQPSFNMATAGSKYCVIMEAGPTIDPLNATAVTTKQPWRIAVDVQLDQQVLLHTGSPITLFDVEKLPVTYELQTGDTKLGAGWQPTDIVGTTGAKYSSPKLEDSVAAASDFDPSVKPDSAAGGSRPGYISKEVLKSDGSYQQPGIVPAYKVTGDANPSYIQGSSSANTRYPFLDNDNLRWVVDPNGTITDPITDDNSTDSITKGFINRTKRIGGANAEAYPMSYRLVITNRGFWLGVWEESTTQEGSKYFNWILVQRPVDRTTGAVIVDGKAPVFCVNAVGGKFWKFVVRESDIMRPSTRVDAAVDSEDAEAILNIENQVSLSEDGKYIITFPSRLNTSRYRYPHELDIMATTSADVVSQNTSVELTVYGEAEARIYRALHANGAANTGMRVMILEEGGGID